MFLEERDDRDGILQRALLADSLKGRGLNKNKRKKKSRIINVKKSGGILVSVKQNDKIGPFSGTFPKAVNTNANTVYNFIKFKLGYLFLKVK